MPDVYFRDLGSISYPDAWEYQDKLFKHTVQLKIDNRKLPEGATPVSTKNYLLFCEHPPVITLGKSGHMDNLLLNEEGLKNAGIEFYKVNRGGDITFHGPQQIVGYPILDLDYFFTDIHKYLRLLEEMIIRTLAEYGIEAERLPGATGVWIDADVPAKARKICAMGIRCSRWVTMHGWALNVNTDLNYFNMIVPCGITDKQVTSIEKELGHPVPVGEVKEKLRRHFSELFGCRLIDDLIAAE